MVWPLAAVGQQHAQRRSGDASLNQPTPKQHRIAFVHSAFPAAELTEHSGPYWVRRFFQELRRLGFAEGHNLSVIRMSAEGDRDRYAALSHALASRNPDLIIANSNLLVDALRAATTIPIAGVLGDPLTYGTVGNLARPGGTVTGVSIDAGVAIHGKRLETLKQALPSVSRVGFLAASADWTGAGGGELRRAARELSVSLVEASPHNADTSALQQTFARLSAQSVDALLVSASGEWLPHQRVIVDLAREHRLPTMYPYRDYVEAGGLFAYTPDLNETAMRLANAVAQMLRGASPGDIPIQQPTTFDLIVNLKAAREIGITVSQSIIAQANEVIE